MEARPEGGFAEEEVAHHSGKWRESCAKWLGVVGEGLDETRLVLLTEDAEDECLSGCGGHPVGIKGKHIHRSLPPLSVERPNLSEWSTTSPVIVSGSTKPYILL